MNNDDASLFSLEGKVAIITGASRGIGEEIAKRFSKAGARLIICSRKMEALECAAEQIRKEGGDTRVIQADVTVPEDRERIIASAIEWGASIDILVNNAGANPKYGGLEDLSEKDFDQIVDVNLKAGLFLSQLAYKRWMKENGGVILNISSIAGWQCSTGINGYTVVKAALNHLTRCLASEWGHNGLRVNALAPGLIKTNFSRALWENPAFGKAIKRNPIPKIGRVEDVAGAALFLVSEAASYVTGHILVADGGMLVRDMSS